MLRTIFTHLKPRFTSPRHLRRLAVAVAVAIGGCDTSVSLYDGGGQNPGDQGAPQNGLSDGGPPQNGLPDGAIPAQTGIPCDVAQVLTSCLGCHGNPPTRGAPIPLVSYDELAATSPKGGTYAGRSVTRMMDNQSPMPPAPGPRISSLGIATVAAWVGAGLPKGACGAPNPDGGVTDGGIDPYNTPDTCTSKVYWKGGEQDWMNYPKTAMHPGKQCIDCHDNPGKYGLPDNGPGMWIGGTVYATAHEYDECFGENGGNRPANVVITDANNRVITLHSNVSGGFYLLKGIGTPAVAFPIHASVTAGGKTRVMSQTVQTGDCNSCHTLKGAQNAPGRIMLP